MWGFTFVVILDLILDLIYPFFTDQTLTWGGTKSVLRNAVTYAVVALGYPYLSVIGAEPAATAFLVAFIYQYLMWIVTTWTEMGWWLPETIKKFVKSNMSEADIKKFFSDKRGDKK